MRVRGDSVILHLDGRVQFSGGMTIDADGGRRTYAPRGSGLQPLDYLGNAGGPGNWYGILTDSHEKPVVQGPDDPAPGYYISATSYQRHEFQVHDPRRYLDPEHEPFFVVPGELRMRVAPVVLGCVGSILDEKTGRELACVVGDLGPATHLGEASIFVAEYFGVDPSPKWGGTKEERFVYTFWPGISAPGYELQAAA